MFAWRFVLSVAANLLAVLFLLALSACQSQGQAFQLPPTATPALPSPTAIEDEAWQDAELVFPVAPSPLPSHPPPASPPPSPPVPTPTSKGPEMVSDLLFLQDGNLMRWNPVTDYTGLLAYNVSEFSASADGRRIALLRSSRITGGGLERYNLDLLDLASLDIATLLPATPRIYSIRLSPDAAWVAYTEDPAGGAITAISTGEVQQRKRMGDCQVSEEHPCSGPLWAPDSQAVLWSDAQGVWLSKFTHSQPLLTQVQANTIPVTDPKGGQTRVSVQYNNLVWSPAGRYVLGRITLRESGVEWHTVIDTRRNRLVQTPDTYTNRGELPVVRWLTDGKLVVARSSGQPGEAAAVRVWWLVDTAQNLFLLQKEFALHTTDLPGSLPPELLDVACAPGWAIALDDHTLALTFSWAAGQAAPLLVKLDLEYERLSPVHHALVQTSEVLWSPDGRGALVLDSQGRPYYAHPNGAGLQDLPAQLGEHLHQFFWLPPKRLAPVPTAIPPASESEQ